MIAAARGGVIDLLRATPPAANGAKENNTDKDYDEALKKLFQLLQCGWEHFKAPADFQATCVTLTLV